MPIFSIGFGQVARIPCAYIIDKEPIIENQYNKVYSAKTSTLGIFIHLKSKLSVQIISKTNYSFLTKNLDHIAARLMSIRSANLPQSTPAFSNRALISPNLIQQPGEQPYCMRLLIYDPLQQLSSYIDHFTPRNRPRSTHSSRYIRFAAIQNHGQRTSGSASRTCGYSFPGHGFEPNCPKAFFPIVTCSIMKLSKSGIYTKRKRAKRKKRKITTTYKC